MVFPSFHSTLQLSCADSALQPLPSSTHLFTSSARFHQALKELSEGDVSCDESTPCETVAYTTIGGWQHRSYNRMNFLSPHDPILQDYANDIRAALEDQFELDLKNDSRKHALIVMRDFIASARDEIILLCHKLSKEIYDDDEVVKALDLAYSRNRNLKCIAMVREKLPDDSAFLSVLIRNGAGIYCGIGNNKTTSEHHSGVAIQDAIVVDRRAARIETDAQKRHADVIVCKRSAPRDGHRLSNKMKRVLETYIMLRELHAEQQKVHSVHS